VLYHDPPRARLVRAATTEAAHCSTGLGAHQHECIVYIGLNGCASTRHRAWAAIKFLLRAPKGHANSELLLTSRSAGLGSRRASYAQSSGESPEAQFWKSSTLEFYEKIKLSQANAAAIVPVTSPSGLWGRIFSFPAVLTGSLTYLVFVLSRRDIADPDLWWHLRNAQFLLQQHHFPLADSYSYTAPGARVLPFEWLAELPYYAAYKWAGLTAVFWLVFVLCTAIVLGVFRLSYLASRDVKNAFIASVGGAVLAAISIGARTLLFGWLYLVVLLLILAAFREGSWKWLWLVPPLFCLWINSHGSWPMGFVLFGIFIASGLVEGSWGKAYATRWSAAQLWKLLTTAGASAMAVFVNPFGYHLVLYPFRVMFGAGTGVEDVEEFASVNFHTPWGKVAMVLILGVLLSAIFSRVRWSLDEIAAVMVAFYYALTYSRFIFLAGILLPPIFAKRLKLMEPYDRNSDKKLNNAVALAILLGVFAFSVPRHSTFRPPVQYPEGAIAYMKTNGIQGRIFHDYVWGGYLIWHAPELKVFVDGRYDPYGPNGVFKDYMVAVSGENPQAIFDKYRVNYVLMPADSLLVPILRNSSKWTVRYSDKNSVLLQRSPIV
jgi:hypothetical protein